MASPAFPAATTASISPKAIKPAPEQTALQFEARVQSFLDGLIARDEVAIFPYPDVALRLSELLSRSRYSASDVADVVSADPSLAAAVLRLANSALYSSSIRTITALPAAIARIGVDNLVRVVFASKVGEQACAPGPLSTLKFLVWRQSLMTGLLCQHFAPRRGLRADEAFVCGLLRNFGKIVSIACIEQMLQTHSEAGRSAEEWLKAAELSQRRLAGVVGRKWQLPEPILAIMTDHGVPGAADSNRTMLELSRLAEHVVEAAETTPHLGERELASISGFDEFERRSMIELLPRLPGAIAALLHSDRVPTPPRTGAAGVIQTPAPASRSAVKVNFAVLDSRLKGPVTYRAQELTTEQLTMVGPKPLQTNNLARLQLQCDEPALHVWMRVVACTADGAAFRIEVTPFALGKDERERWLALCGASEPHAEA